VPGLAQLRLEQGLPLPQTKKGHNLRSSQKYRLPLVKNIFCIILFGAAFFVPGFSQAAENTSIITSTTVTVSWDKSPDRTVKGYRLHCGLASGRNYSRTIDVGKVTTYKISNLIPGETYYCVVTAYNKAGRETPASNEVSFTVSRSASKKRQ
jgi:Fibronectin type III domain